MARDLPTLYRSGMRGDEKRVVEAFVAWLQENGWTAVTEVNFVDVFARRGDESLYAEAKGRSAAIGLDVDTLYGQLLRRMGDPGANARYAVVVPATAVPAALRVPAWVRQRLGIDVYKVDDAGQVHPRE
jgi:16S rRNA G966 N2-methylase RsmD